MAIVRITNGILQGLSGDTKPTTYPNGTLFFETNTGNIFMYISSAWTSISSASGEANTASNVGTGQGVFKSKVGIDLQFRSLTTTSSKIALANNTNDVGIDVTEANLTLSNMIGPLSVAKGGTGAATLTGILKGAGTGAITAAALLAVADGGTGAGTLTGVVTGNGTSAFTASNTLAGLTLTTPQINGEKVGDVSKVTGDSPYAVVTTNNVVRADASSGNLTITLPTAVGATGQVYTIKRVDEAMSTNMVTIATTSSQTLSGAANEWLNTGEAITIESDNANWEVIARTTVTLFGSCYKRGTVAGTGSSAGNRRYVAGMLFNNSLLTATTGPAINTLWALPFPVSRTTKFDLVSFMVTTLASAGGVARAGIYRDNGNCYPGALYFDTGSIAVDAGSTTLPRDTTITAGLQTFAPGLYWLAWECGTATPLIRALPGVSTCVALMGYGSDMAIAPTYAHSIAHTFGALPDPFTTGAGNVTAQSSVSAPVPAIAMRPV